MPPQTALIGPAQRRIYQAAGDPSGTAHDLATYLVGQAVGLLNKVRPTRAVVLDMVSEFIAAVQRLDELGQ